MNQGQHIMAGVRAATQRYYGSKRKGKGRKFSRALSAMGRAAERIMHSAKTFYRSWLQIDGRRVEARELRVFSGTEDQQ